MTKLRTGLCGDVVMGGATISPTLQRWEEQGVEI